MNDRTFEFKKYFPSIPDAENLFSEKEGQGQSQQESAFGLANLVFKQATVPGHIIRSMVDALIDRENHIVISNAINTVIDEELSTVSVPLTLAASFAETRDIDTALQILSNEGAVSESMSINYDLYNYALNESIAPIARIYEEYCLRKVGIDGEWSPAGLVIIRRLNLINKNIATAYEHSDNNAIQNYLSLMDASLKGGAPSDYYREDESPTESFKRIMQALEQGLDTTIDFVHGAYTPGADVEAVAGANNSIYEADMLNVQSIDWADAGNQMERAILNDLINMTKLRQVAGNANAEINRAVNMLNQLKGFLILTQQGDIKQILGFLGRYNAAFNIVSAAVQAFDGMEWANILFGYSHYITDLMDQIPLDGLQRLLPSTSYVMRDVLSKLKSQATSLMMTQKVRMVKKMYYNRLRKNQQSNANSKMNEHFKENSVIKCIDKAISILNKVSSFTDINRLIEDHVMPSISLRDKLNKAIQDEQRKRNTNSVMMAGMDTLNKLRESHVDT